MEKTIKIAVMTALLSLSMTTAAFAGTWKQSDQGKWWWQDEDKSFPTSTWEWIDSDGDGMAECYYFDENGYLLTNTTTPDGYTVNESGEWVDEGVVRQRAASPFAANKMNDEGRILYQDANQKSSQLNAMDVNTKTQMNFSYEGKNLPFVVDYNFKYHDLDSANMEFLLTTSINMMDIQNQKSTIFYTNDGYCYIESDGYKYKYKVDYEDMKTQLSGLQLTNHFGNCLDNIQVTTDADGNKVLFYSANEEDFNSNVKNIFEDVMPYLSDYTIQFNGLSGKAVITPDGYFLKEVVTVNAAVSDGKDSIEMDMDMNINYNNPGQPVTIDFPSTEGFDELVY